ncbi:MAG: GNAT family N-acetyltransferase [Kiritimatiellota bacterium]|nr:GNAT family N-acetyltransferase [Kiritimatiellota bacterium]
MAPDTNPAWSIRPYAAGDRVAVRRICCDTADAGRPVEAFFDDRELIADLLMNYYTDFEPASAWVVIAGEVVGYLTGCRDTGAFRRIMFWRIVPRALFKAFWRGTWWAASTRRLVRYNLPIWWRSLGHRAMPLAGYPAHLHINLRTGMQGQGMGRRLINQFLAQLRAAGISGVHLSVREDNMAAIAFFEKTGFARLDRRPFMRIGPGADDMRYSVVMVQPLKYNHRTLMFMQNKDDTWRDYERRTDDTWKFNSCPTPGCDRARLGFADSAGRSNVGI